MIISIDVEKTWQNLGCLSDKNSKTRKLFPQSNKMQLWKNCGANTNNKTFVGEEPNASPRIRKKAAMRTSTTSTPHYTEDSRQQRDNKKTQRLERIKSSLFLHDIYFVCKNPLTSIKRPKRTKKWL
jgi:hypothetical protein